MKFFLLINLLFFITFTNSYSKKNSLYDFYSQDCKLSCKIDSIFYSLNDTLLVGQMLIVSAGQLGKDDATVLNLAKKGYIGSIIYLRGTKAEHIERTKKINSHNSSLPILYSMDAEPTLLHKRIIDAPNVVSTNKIINKEISDKTCDIINSELNEIGIKLNYAPVCDVSTTNKAIKTRSYGSNVENVVKYSKYFIEKSTEANIATTIKHFPGHGLIKGDSHHDRIFINGKLEELEIYKKMISDSIFSVMVGHIDVINNEKYNTNGIPSSCSRKIVTDLLKNELKFKGIVITDGLEMHALKNIKNPAFEASKAGCDMLCIPKDEEKTIKLILDEMRQNPKYRQQIYESVKKIIRLKICLNLF